MLGYCTCGSSAVGYLGPFLTHLTVQDGVDVRVLYLWELCCWVSWSIPHTSDSAGWCGCCTVPVGALLLGILVHSSHI